MDDQHTRSGTGMRKAQDILLIEDVANGSADDKISTEECDGSAIIIAHSLKTARRALEAVAVDVIYNVLSECSHEEAEEFRRHAAKRCPESRVVDRWSAASSEGAQSNYLVPIHMREGSDCNKRRMLWMAGKDASNGGSLSATGDPARAPEGISRTPSRDSRVA